MVAALKRLIAHYPDPEPPGQRLKAALARCQSILRRREQALLDAAAAVTALYCILLTDRIDESLITPQLQEAFERALPGKTVEWLRDQEGPALEGSLNLLKGTFFEILVRDRLNAGEAIGDVLLAHGQYASLALASNQAGWDLEIWNVDGTPANVLQAKATDSLGYVKKALERYPDIDIVATSEAARLEGVIDSSISNSSLEEAVRRPFEQLLDSDLTDALEGLVPTLPFVLIIGTEGRYYLTGRQTFAQATMRTLRRSGKSLAAIATGSLVFAIVDSGLLSLMGTFAIRYVIDAVEASYKLDREAGKALERLRNLQYPQIVNQRPV